MSALTINRNNHLTRRNFLKLAGASFAALCLPSTINTVNAQSQPILASPPRLGRVIANNTRVHEKPSLKAPVLKKYFADHVLSITDVTVGDEEPAYNRVWYQLNGEGYVHSGGIHPVDVSPNEAVSTIAEEGRLAEVTVPYTDCTWSPLRSESVVYRLYYGTTYWVTGLVQDAEGVPWYSYYDEKWKLTFYAKATHLHLINPEELKPISPDLPPEAKRIEIMLEEQAVIAYEYDRPVFISRAATGARFSDGDFRTSPGRYLMNRKRPSRHMADGDFAAPASYDLPGVPWVSYLTESGISFHGTYWHNDFGKPRSHGCINLPTPAARWIYLWTNPDVPWGERYFQNDPGTIVDVI
jgi:lipoprotein-anchoring transpeptidase ErfK/SrfK